MGWNATLEDIAEVLGYPKVAHSVIAEDLSNGEYVIAFAQSFCGEAFHGRPFVGEAKKEPGVAFHGRPFVGRVLLIRGFEAASPSSHRVLDYHCDAVLDEAFLSAVDATWLSIRQARAARAEYTKRAIEFFRANGREIDAIVGNLLVAPPAEFGECAACGAGGAKRKCGACRKVYYCDADCQSGDWPAHRRWCS